MSVSFTKRKIAIICIAAYSIMVAYAEYRAIPAILVKLKLDVFGMTRPGIELMSKVDDISSHADEVRYPNGMTAKDIYLHSSAESKEITKKAGAGRDIYVLSTDPRLKYFLANLRDVKYQRYADIEPESMPYNKTEYNRYSTTIARTILGISRERWGQLSTYLSMTDYFASASVEISLGSDGYRVIYLRPESTPALLKYSELPYSTPLAQVNQWSLPHELAHSWDSELTDRKHNSAELNKRYSISEDNADLIAESIADLTTALIMLRITENNDTLEYQIIPFRTRIEGDHIHATQYLLGKTYDKFTLADVVGKTDLELSQLAISAINDELSNNFSEMDQFISNHKYKIALMIAAELTPFKKLPNMIKNAKTNSRSALESSIKNTIYQGNLDSKCKTLREAIKTHNKYYDDVELITALRSTPNICNKDEYNLPSLVKFSHASGFIIDWASQSRLNGNQQKIDSYYQALTDHRAGFEKPNIK